MGKGASKNIYHPQESWINLTISLRIQLETGLIIMVAYLALLFRNKG